MSMRKQTAVDNEGALRHILQYDDADVEYDTIEIQHDADDDNRLHVYAYNEDGDCVYQRGFELRDLSFDPISAIGKGETDKLQGTSSADGDDVENIPSDVQTALNAVGMAVVPDGTGWLDGE